MVKVEEYVQGIRIAKLFANASDQAAAKIWVNLTGENLLCDPNGVIY